MRDVFRESAEVFCLGMLVGLWLGILVQRIEDDGMV